MLTAAETLDGLRRLGFTVSGRNGNLIIDGPTHLLDARRRGFIKHNKLAILRLLACAPEPEDDDYAQREREAIQWADTDDAWRYLDYAVQLFGPSEVTMLDTPEKIARHKEGLLSGGEVDAWLAKCNHHPERGTWHKLDGDKCCRYCGGIYEIIMARHANAGIKAKSDGAATPTLF